MEEERMVVKMKMSEVLGVYIALLGGTHGGKKYPGLLSKFSEPAKAIPFAKIAKKLSGDYDFYLDEVDKINRKYGQKTYLIQTKVAALDKSYSVISTVMTEKEYTEYSRNHELSEYTVLKESWVFPSGTDDANEAMKALLNSEDEYNIVTVSMNDIPHFDNVGDMLVLLMPILSENYL